MNVTEALKNRLSANVYDTNAEISKEQVTELVELATEFPSSFNSQNWRVIVIIDPEFESKFEQPLGTKPGLTPLCLRY